MTMRGGRAAALLLLLGLAPGGPAGAAEVTINPGLLPSNLGVFAGDTSIVDDRDLPTSLPYTETRSVNLGATRATALHDFGNSGFAITIALAHSGNNGAAGGAAGEIFFSVDTAVDYAASGVLAAINQSGYEITQELRLEDVTNGATLFRSFNRSDSTADVLFTVGVASGDISTSVFGDLTGTLLPGIEYQLLWNTNLEIFTDTSPATANGGFSLVLVPEPASGMLVLLGLLALAGGGGGRAGGPARPDPDVAGL